MAPIGQDRNVSRITDAAVNVALPMTPVHFMYFGVFDSYFVVA